MVPIHNKFVCQGQHLIIIGNVGQTHGFLPAIKTSNFKTFTTI